MSQISKQYPNVDTGHKIDKHGTRINENLSKNGEL